MEYFAPGIDVAGIVGGLTEPDLEAMLSDVWATLDLPEASAEIDPAVGETLSALADLHGDAENRGSRLNLMVTVDRGAAGLLTAAFFGAAEASDAAAVDDAVGELANMCAGAVKTLLDGEWVIGIPYQNPDLSGRGDGWIEATVPVEVGWVRLAIGECADADDESRPTGPEAG